MKKQGSLASRISRRRFMKYSAGAALASSASAPAILAQTRHGGPFVSAIERENVLGVQFHPERSGGDGLRVLANFVRWAAALAAGRGAEYSPVGAGGTSGGD